MRPIVWITGAALVAAAGAFLLHDGLRPFAWGAIGLTYLALCTAGAAWPAAGIFGRVRTAVHGAADQVALTYDDGPDPRATAGLLDLLARRGVQAAFFCVGQRVLAHPELVRRCRAEGHLIGNHSHRHRSWTPFLLGQRLGHELDACQAAIRQVAGVAPRFFRPPFGILNHAMEPACRRRGLQMIGWQVRGLDTLGQPVETVVARVLRKLRPGGIVLLHDGDQEPQRVVAITDRLLDGIAARGLRPVRLDRLLALAPCAGEPVANDSA